MQRKRGIIKVAEADDILRNISEVDGFRNVVKLLCAAEDTNKGSVVVRGALYELRTALMLPTKGA